MVNDPEYSAALAAKRKAIEESMAAKRQRTDSESAPSSSRFLGQPSDEIYAASKDISSTWPPTPRVSNEPFLPTIPDICLALPTNQDELDLQKSGMTGWHADMLEALKFWVNLPAAPPKPTLRPEQRKTKKFYEASAAYQEACLLNKTKPIRINQIKDTIVKAGFSPPEGV